ncbi:MAG: hypothetical protein JNM43_11470 [Planctomycetaceae bacterium]|nr:hypothetical protein [Planctomycetaceae bacterium]
MAFEDENPYRVDTTVVLQQLPIDSKGPDESSEGPDFGQHIGILIACFLVSLFVFLATLFLITTIWQGLVMAGFVKSAGRPDDFGGLWEIACSLLVTAIACIKMRRRLIRTLQREG